MPDVTPETAPIIDAKAPASTPTTAPAPKGTVETTEPKAPAEPPKPKAEASKKFLQSLAVTQKTRQEQLSLKEQQEKFAADLKEANELKSLKTQIEAARVKGDIDELHRLLNIPEDASKAWRERGGKQLTPVEKELAETKSRLTAIEEERKKAQEAVGNREQEQAMKDYIEEIHGEVDKYPLIALLKQGPFVVQTMQAEAKASGKAPDPDAVMMKIEKGFGDMVTALLDHPKGLDFIVSLVDKKRAPTKVAKKEPKETKEPLMTQTDKKDPRPVVRFGGHKSALDEAMAEAEQEVRSSKK